MRYILMIAGLFLAFQSSAQEKRFFVPKEIRDAYEAGTRSRNGAPGPNYWQNTVDYTIEASLDPSTREISGDLSATYYNNSPNTLNTIVIRLYHDVFKKSNKRLMQVTPSDINEGVEISAVSVNGTPYQLGTQQVRRSGTNMFISLTEPLESGSSLTFETSWSYVIPETLRRTGVYDSTSYHVAYWYPQFSVYDDIFGWDTMDYTFQTEFYNNLANYDVKITIPNRFNIWATGVLQNPGEVFTDEILERYNQAKSSTEVVNIITDSDLNAGFANKGDTWHYTAEEVSDFAFSVSDHYLWDAAIQRVEDRDVLISTVFPKGQAVVYKDVTPNQQKAMKHFSEDVPGIPYPYPAFTTFIGLRGGGMEFPMMANNAGPGLGVTVHEMFHTYFPMYVRINERRFAYMDEGWAQYITKIVTERYFQEGEPPFEFEGLASGSAPMGTFEDLPLISSSQFMDGSNYGYASYSLPGYFYGMLHHYLGDEKFLEAYRTYIRRWAKKSPTPYDFIYTFEDVTKEDLSWLWEPWFFSYGNADLALTDLKNGKVTVEKVGSRPVPVKVDVYYSDGGTQTTVLNAKVWEKTDEVTIPVQNIKEMDYLMVSQGVPDENNTNNIYPSLKEIYAKKSVDQAVKGEYGLDQYPVSMFIEEEDGVLTASIPQAGLASELLPVSEGKFKAVSGVFEVELTKDEEGVYSKATMNIQGQKLTATRK